MKKLLFMFATAALVLSACSSEDDIVQNGGSLPQLGAAADAVGFDVYTQQATNVTKAGLVGTMTTNRMQLSEANGGGFGVYAFLTEDAIAAAGDGANATAYTPTDPASKANVPNFMVNEKILWNSTNLGWYYNPLKYWPNETDNDSQTTPAYMENSSTPKHLDRLTFFAYAPYVAAGSGTGITAITDKNGYLNSAKTSDPTIAWKATTDDADYNPNEGVDLLWGVAPSGGLSYTAVNGWTVTKSEGTPLIDMIKPNVNTSMKFLFQHALARFGVTVVAAVDQVAPGGDLDANTKITINSFKITGPFGTGGELNLNNGVNANIANWTKMTGGAAAEAISGSTTTLTSDKVITVSTAIADNLKYAGVHTFGSYSAQNVVGVTTAKQDLLDPSNQWYTKLASKPAYNPGKQYFTESAGVYTPATATATITGSEGYYELSGDDYNKKASGTINSPAFPEAVGTDYVTIDATNYPAGADPGIAEVTTKLYKMDASDNFVYVATYAELVADNGGDWTHNGSIYDASVSYCSIVTSTVPLEGITFTYPDGTYYEAERNYLYVVPTNNVAKNPSAEVDNLRTISVEIEYYITTEDSKISGGRTQTKNVVTKQVVLPSLANGKSYNLNLVLGLTSVKIEAEVDDWKVANSQVDLPQNTGE